MKIGSRDLVGSIWEWATSEGKQGHKKCPQCAVKMTEFYANPNDQWVELDLCNTCFLIWFDRDETTRISDLKTNQLRPPTSEEIESDVRSKRKGLLTSEKSQQLDRITKMVYDFLHHPISYNPWDPS